MSIRTHRLLALVAAVLFSSVAQARRHSTPRLPTAFRYADASFQCRLSLEDFRGDQRFVVKVLAGHKVVQARARGGKRRPGVRLYWSGVDGRWHPWGTLTTKRLREKCRLAQRLERTHWPLDRIYDTQNVGPYLAGRLLCADGAPRAVQVARGHGPKPRRRVVCELPAYLRGAGASPGAGGE